MWLSPPIGSRLRARAWLRIVLCIALAPLASAQPAPVPIDDAALDSMLEASGVEVPTVSAPAAAPPPAQESSQPEAPAPASAPPTSPAQVQPPPSQTLSPTLADSLRSELEMLRAAVTGLAAQRDSLAAALADRPSRVDTVVVEDTTRAVAQARETIDDVRETAKDALQGFVPNLIISIILLFVALYIVRGVGWLLEALAARSAERRLFYKKLLPIVRLAIWALAVYLIIAAVFKVSANSLIAAATAVGVAVGFAAQDVLKNIFGGIIIILDQPFQVGDKVAVGDSYGEVVSIGLRSTRIVTPDDNLVSVPNAQIVDGQVSNANAGELNLQVVTDLWLPGWVDVARAKRIAYEAAANSKYVYLDKPIVVIVKDEFKETFLLHLKVKAYVLDTRYEFLLMSDVTEAAKTEFLRQGLLETMEDVTAYTDALEDMNAAHMARETLRASAGNGPASGTGEERRVLTPTESRQIPDPPEGT